MKIDHVTIAGSDLKVMQDEFENLGMKTDYGGPHSSGFTHMSLLGFNDGSYIELISSLKPGAQLWEKQIRENGGPCAWAIGVKDIASELLRLEKLGVSVTGPDDYSRARPDGVLVEWKLGFIGDKAPGATLPFLIEDKTPREFRVTPSLSVADNKESDHLIGLQKVILGVSELEKEIKLFQKLYGWGEPMRSAGFLDGATLAEFENTPVTLATSSRSNSWLSSRLGKFGDSPCAYLIGTNDLKWTVGKYGLGRENDWFQNKVAWIPSEKLNGTMLGFIQ